MKKRTPTHHEYDFADPGKLVCLVCRDHFILVGYLAPLPADLTRIPRDLLRGRALAMVGGAEPMNTRDGARLSGAADSGPACRPSAGSSGGEG